MIGIIFIYYVGNYFYKLAAKFDKNKWLFAIIGLAVYYGSTLFLGLIYGIILELTDNSISESTTETLILAIAGLVAGLTACYFLHKFLENKWQLEAIENKKDGIDNIGQVIEEL
jgi:formate-dependent nitrite reductase membrane component NrfD